MAVASASMRLLTAGWSGEQRRALMRVLDPRQRRMVRDRIEVERLAKRIEADEAADALQFLGSDGEHGMSCGVPEWAAAALFGRDPAFRGRWQEIRRMHDAERGEVA